MLKNLQVFNPISLKGSSLTPADISYWSNPRCVEKIQKTLDNTAYDLNIAVMLGYGDWVSKDNLIQHFGLEHCSRAINLIYRSNATAPQNYIPMTAWILAHRIHHLMMVDSDDTFQQLMQLEKTLWHSLITIANLVFDNVNDFEHIEKHYVPMLCRKRDFFNGPPQQGSLKNSFDQLQSLLHVGLTMRSARMRLITNHLDHTAECLAQHVITGCVKFNTVNNIDWQYLAVKHPNELRSRIDHSHLDQVLYEQAAEIDAVCRQTMLSLIGKTLVF